VLDYGPGPDLEQNWNRGFYATTVFQDSQGRTVLLGWISGFKPNRGWRGCMGLPRILTIDEDVNLIQTPIPELEKLRGNRSAVNDLVLDSEEKRLDEVNGDALEIIAEFEAGDATAFGLKIRQSTDGGEAITIRYQNGNLNVAGTDVPLDLAANSGRLKLQVFLDKSVLEVFINDGLTSVSQVEYAGQEDMGVSVFAEGGIANLKSLEAWEIKSIW
jgi:sucrose-6-phosphate hydrolase SacC (GH32 family)